MIKLVGLGFLLVGLTALVGWLVAGEAGFRASCLAGLLGLGAHLLAAKLIRHKLKSDLQALAGAYVAGIAIRFGGVAIAFAAVRYDDGFFPPGPTLIGYVAVLVPMLFMEIRFLK